ncbi:Endolytic murein transglycosylase [Alphaproteobacteria bacterium]
MLFSIGFTYYICNWHVEKDTTLLIPQNSSVLAISEILKDASIIHDKYAFLMMFKLYTLLHHNQTIKAGGYEFTKGMSMFAVITKMVDGIVIKYKLTIPEGYTAARIIESVNAEKNIIKLPILDIAEPEEGYLFPETYVYTYGATNLDLLLRMHQAMDKFLREEWLKRDKRIDAVIRSPHDALVLASIIEKETILESEKSIIAGVYINRLKKNMRLQADPTVIYGLTRGIKNFRRRVTYQDLKHVSDYNTYLNSGLPPTPVCNPGQRAIIAALHPHWVDKLYFVADGTGGHLFSATFDEHKKNITKIKNKSVDDTDIAAQ